MKKFYFSMALNFLGWGLCFIGGMMLGEYGKNGGSYLLLVGGILLIIIAITMIIIAGCKNFTLSIQKDKVACSRSRLKR